MALDQRLVTTNDGRGFNTQSTGVSLNTNAVSNASGEAPIDAFLGWLTNGGKVITAFLQKGYWSFSDGIHRGVDIASNAGNPIRSPVAGKVVDPKAYGLSAGYGRAITVLDDQGRLNIFGHSNGPLLPFGSNVSIGTLLGTVGDHRNAAVGEATAGDHIHYEIRGPGSNGAPSYYNQINPLDVLRGLGPFSAGAIPNVVGGIAGGVAGSTGGNPNQTPAQGTTGDVFTGPVVPLIKTRWGDVNFNLGWILKLFLSLFAFALIFFGILKVFSIDKAVGDVISIGKSIATKGLAK